MADRMLDQEGASCDEGGRRSRAPLPARTNSGTTRLFKSRAARRAGSVSFVLAIVLCHNPVGKVQKKARFGFHSGDLWLGHVTFPQRSRRFTFRFQFPARNGSYHVKILLTKSSNLKSQRASTHAFHRPIGPREEVFAKIESFELIHIWLSPSATMNFGNSEFFSNPITNPFNIC